MKRILTLIAFFILLSNLSHAQQKDTCKIGIYVTSIFDFSLSEKAFSVDFWMWFNYKNDSLQMLGSTEIVNAKEFEFLLPDTEKKNNINWATQKCRATIKKEWDVRHFPFDKQKLIIEIEEANADTSSMVFVPDIANSKYDKRIHIEGWKISDFKVKAEPITYETSYGDPELASGSSTYPAATVTFTIEREGTGLFFKLFTGLYVAFGISLLVFFMGPENAERFGLLVGALFAAIGNKYIVDSMLPETTMYTLVDKIHVLTFVFILINLIITVIAYRFYATQRVEQARKTDWYSFLFVITAYIAINALLVVSAF
ncbi:MAG: hypothetical protein ACJ75J_07210 [Cytophagaceae bacterium]